MRSAPGYARCALVLAVVACLALFANAAQAVEDASGGYETIRPSLVKVWSFDRTGRPLQSGTGIVVEANAHRSLVLTASHVVAGAADIRIDVSRDVHDLPARIERTGPRDLTLLAVDLGSLRVARFAARTRAVVEGNLVAVAGYVKNDELIGIAGQEPRVLFPGTVSSRPDNGRYLELENVHIEEGLSGGPVFDPATGEVLGIVTSRTSDRRGGFADSGALVVVPFLEAANVAVAEPSPLPRRRPAPAVAAPLVAAPSVAGLLAAPHVTAVALPLVRPQPAATLEAVLALAPPPPQDASGIVSWQMSGAAPKDFVYTRAGCRVTVTLDVETLRFVVAHQALVQPRKRGAMLAISMQERTESCSGVAGAEPADGAYEPTAMSYDGHHVTMRFVYAGDPAAADRFPADAGLDADLAGDAATATLQFFDRNWNVSVTLPLERTALAAVSDGW